VVVPLEHLTCVCQAHWAGQSGGADRWGGQCQE